MTVVAGVDGCPAGWVVVTWGAEVTHRLCFDFAEVVSSQGEVIAVDMPIGFADDGNRAAERAARKVLGARQSSLFAMPSRAAVACLDYREACGINLRHTEPPKKIAKQAFNLFPKIREVDALMTPALQVRVQEVHPELAFWAMNGCRPLETPKKIKSKVNPEGLHQRRGLLRNAGFPVDELPPVKYRRSEVGDDDVLDACACAVAARRILEGRAIHFPDFEERDVRGLLMRISC